MKLTKNKVAQQLARNRLAIHLECFVVRDRVHGTYLRNLSHLKLNDLFTAYEMYRRTGVNTMATDGRIIITFNNIAKAVGLDPNKKTNFTAAEKKEILADITTRMDTWASGIGPFKGAPIEPLDPEFKKHAPKVLHTIFGKRGGETQAISLDALSAYYVATLGEEDEEADLDEIKDNLKKLCKQMPETFAIGSGPAPKVVRLLDARGKPTEGEPPKERAARGTANGAAGGVQRYTSRVQQLGFTSKNHFLTAKRDIGSDAPTMAQLKSWLDKQ